MFLIGDSMHISSQVRSYAQMMVLISAY